MVDFWHVYRPISALLRYADSPAFYNKPRPMAFLTRQLSAPPPPPHTPQGPFSYSFRLGS